MFDVRAALIFTGVLVTAALSFAADPKPGSSECLTYVKPDGEAFFAVTLKTDVAQVSEDPRQIVVLFDTSASQVGVYRDKALAVLAEFVKGLRAQDSVRIFTIDIDAKPLTQKFLGAKEPIVDKAFDELKKRTPLGATDLPLALDNAVYTWGPEVKELRSVVLISDGMSPANLFDPKSLPEFLARAVERKVSINSYIIGPRTDVALAATIANHTGGVVAVDTPELDAKKFGQFLANAVHSEVYWPTRTRMPDQVVEYLPEITPPLRTDRETVLIGRGKFERPFRIEISVVDVAGKKTDLGWNVVPTPADDVNAYLVELVTRARPTKGMLLPLAGAAALREAKGALANDLATIVSLGQQALALNNPESAEQLARKALSLDPNSPDAQAILGGARKKWIESAELAIQKKELEQAAQLLLRALAIDPQDPQATKLLESLPKVTADKIREQSGAGKDKPATK